VAGAEPGHRGHRGAASIGAFQGEIAKLVTLAVLMPIVASVGGNAGTQTLAVAVRALAAAS
jgi:magnesium transporter